MKKFLFITLCALLFVGAAHAYAQSPSSFCNGSTCTYTPLEPLSPFDQGGYTNIQSYLRAAFTILLSLGGLFAVTMLTLSGIRYMLSESGADKNKAKERIKSSIYGLLLLASSWLILYTINPKLLTFSLDLTIPGYQPVPAQITSQNSQPRTDASSYKDALSCSGSGNVWLGDSATCIAPLSLSLSTVWGENQSSNPTLIAAAKYLDSLSTVGSIAGSIGLGHTVTNGQIFDRTSENTPQDIQRAADFNARCQAQNYFGKAKIISGDLIGVPGQDVQICYK